MSDEAIDLRSSSQPASNQSKVLEGSRDDTLTKDHHVGTDRRFVRSRRRRSEVRAIGIAEFHVGDEPGEVFDRADRAMYLAKELGRNRCCSERDVPYVAASAAAPASTAAN